MGPEIDLVYWELASILQQQNHVNLNALEGKIDGENVIDCIT